jgi:hypothetical protein
MKKPVPVSYSQASYNAEHAFLFTAVEGTSRCGRTLKSGAERYKPGDLILLTGSLEPSIREGTKWLQRELTLDQFAQTIANRD